MNRYVPQEIQCVTISGPSFCMPHLVSEHISEMALASQGLRCQYFMDSSAVSSLLAVCSIVGHFSPLGEDTSELKDGDVVKM